MSVSETFIKYLVFQAPVQLERIFEKQCKEYGCLL